MNMFKILVVFLIVEVIMVFGSEIGERISLPVAQRLVPTAEAIVGRPLTPISYAGVARRSTVRVGAPGVGVAPGVGAGGVGGPASGVGVLPGAGAGQAGVGYSGGVGVNLGGPVNRVGVR